MIDNNKYRHKYSQIYPQFADHWYTRSARLDPNTSARGVLLDYKLMQTCLGVKRHTQMSEYMPMKIVLYSILKDRPEFDFRRAPKKHLYWNRVK